jgi:NTP pyrophosphatase (non-canonical NTP hydrolase)
MLLSVFTKLSPAKPTKVYDTYWRFAVERQSTFFRRIENPSGPWTENPILTKYKFTNTYRASDRVSQFLIKDVIYQGDQSVQEIFFRIFIFKFFNKIETWNLLRKELSDIVWKSYSFRLYDKILSSAMKRGDTIYSAAYIMPTASGFDGERKHQTHLKLLERMMKEDLASRLAETKSLRAAFELLRTYPMMGDFLAFQFVIDLNYSSIINFSEMDFVVPGPGARDGIKKCFETTGGLSESDIIRVVAERQHIEFERLGLNFRDLWGRPLQLIDCQNLFCEVDKYSRVAHPDVQGLSGRSRIKQIYKPISTLVNYWYPPKWNINDLASQDIQKNKLTCKDNKHTRKEIEDKSFRQLDFEVLPLKSKEIELNMKKDSSIPSIYLDEYQEFVKRTDMSRKLGKEGISFALLGLYGETGSLLSELKKKHREPEAYQAFSESVIEEFGDVLWYLADLAERSGVKLSVIAQTVGREQEIEKIEAQALSTFGEIQQRKTSFVGPNATQEYERMLMRVGAAAGAILSSFDAGLAFKDTKAVRILLAKFFRSLIDAADEADISLERAARENMRKVTDRWPIDRGNRAPLFDEDFEPDEQLPRLLEIAFAEKITGNKKYVIQKWRGVKIGDQLTDNMIEDDGYRFHDVFHLSYAAILGWSPVLRSMLKHKRKSNPLVDEVQDGARAVIIEEGVSTWIFNHASKRRFFEGLESLDYNLLKDVRRLVSGFEVDKCPLWQWERAILEGFRVFRDLRKHRSGIVVADLLNKQISFRIAS